MTTEPMKFNLWRYALAVLLACTIAVHANDTPPQPVPPPQADNLVAITCGVIVIGVGGYCIFRLYKLCKKLFPPEQPPDTNAPPPLQTNLPPVTGGTNNPFAMMLDDGSVNYVDISNIALIDKNYPMRQPALWDTNAPIPVVYRTKFITQFQVSDDLIAWNTWLTVTGWQSPNGLLTAFYSNDVPLVVSYAKAGETNFAPIPLPDKPKQFFRLAAP